MTNGPMYTSAGALTLNDQQRELLAKLDPLVEAAKTDPRAQARLAIFRQSNGPALERAVLVREAEREAAAGNAAAAELKAIEEALERAGVQRPLTKKLAGMRAAGQHAAAAIFEQTNQLALQQEKAAANAALHGVGHVAQTKRSSGDGGMPGGIL